MGLGRAVPATDHGERSLKSRQGWRTSQAQAIPVNKGTTGAAHRTGLGGAPVMQMGWVYMVRNGTDVKRVGKQTTFRKNTHLTGEGDEARSRLLSVFRGLPCGSEGWRGARKDMETVEDLRDPTAGRSLLLPPLCDVRRDSSWKLSATERGEAMLTRLEALVPLVGEVVAAR